jgi:hypothetical protein
MGKGSEAHARGLKYKEHANELRLLAAKMATLEMRRQLLDLADQYERLVELNDPTAEP